MRPCGEDTDASEWPTDVSRVVETIADLVGNAGIAVTEKVYRHQLKAVITKGAETMNTILSQYKSALGRLPVWLPPTDQD
ncbi:hypothetical protein GCM10023196_079840 [Actinoallomurus vinaceus]|uniref:Uncharacterized protein n=1 Tax=Actinoallomurus vinaceus TaxID=1080074 RepID=A0ABP8UPW3_9ACTN